VRYIVTPSQEKTASSPAGEPRLLQPLPQGLPLEVDRGEDKAGRGRHAEFGQPLPLPLLGVRVVDLEDPQPVQQVAAAIGE
jgi:hypothetical protein